jgi:hypothetical protein
MIAITLAGMLARRREGTSVPNATPRRTIAAGVAFWKAGFTKVLGRDPESRGGRPDRQGKRSLISITNFLRAGTSGAGMGYALRFWRA